MVNSEGQHKYWFQNTLTKLKIEVGLQIFLNPGSKYQFGMGNERKWHVPFPEVPTAIFPRAMYSFFSPL